MKIKLGQGLLYKFSIFISLIAISVFHYMYLSSESPLHNLFRLLFFVPIIIAAIKFGFKGGVFTSILVSILYSPFMLLSVGAFGWRTVNELLDVMLYFAFGVIIGTLTEKKGISLQKLDSELHRYILLESYTNSIIESIRSGVIAINNDMLITMINQGAKEIINARNDCIGQNFTDVIDCSEEVKRKLTEFAVTGKSGDSVEIACNRGDSELVVKVSAFPLNLEGSQKGHVIILDDITEMKKMQQQLQRNDRLAALGELSSGIAHEIRNPLGIIKAIEQTMRSELSTNHDAVRELEIIDEEVERANKIVQALMDYGKPSRNLKTECSINAVLDDVLTIVKKYLDQHSVNAIAERIDVPDILLDRDQMKQAFVNIIFNAVQAMPDGGQLKITTSYSSQRYIKVTFEDTGTGIDEKDIDKIFDPFFTTKDEGTGLGLSIVHRIIEEHDGQIAVTGRKGGGTIFEILLPVPGEGKVNP